MNLSVLKKIRVIFSILYFIIITLLFIDFTGLIPPSVYDSIVFLQFVPSLFKFKNLLILAGIGFILIFLLNILFGRVYCSFICPLGTLQDIISFISRKIRKLKKYKYQFLKPYRFIKYSFLTIFVFCLFTSTSVVVSLLDPYSIYGRISSGLFRRILTYGNNILVSELQKINMYSLYRVDLKAEHWTILAVTLFFFVLIILFSVFKGRLYCNTICPVGTFLGLCSKVSFFKIEINKNSCTRCSLCIRSCKAGCIDIRNQSVDFERCVACYNCVNVCRDNAITYTTKKSLPEIKPNSNINGNTRRQFLGILALILAASIKKIKAQEIVTNTATVRTKRQIPISPPGSISVEMFNASCTACHLCISACPTHVLQPSYTDYGLIGFMQPVMDNQAGFCNFECIKCSEVCPTGAITPIELGSKKLTQIGIAHFEQRNCIVETEGTDCGACAEHCPTKAVTMIPWRNGLVIPNVTSEICIGCGACEYACPTTPYKAIYIEGNKVHLTAREPDETTQKKEPEENFPF
ncbi:MAG: hypothetical protein A2X13_01110 [Bacteroidetes bacterium GWC2_33_15]|nr:MAG: hypothetical protein A2X10_08515 [Bacteroidetes bacterium GWA2_33_15]OFX52086.1 MAG: hypothetical protein A2X13_01110 [Bacteroidetes bacterium GWC2_33_15]OFX64240.1 MAG: hypothetical protein A2X15_11930 [Bacteroidetes bacterium GWB2_32_14]OFX67645.1 MAG: hypothetical protein A2X14_05755 [Bacteroidetes bacterium GWD2_33_33]HAN19249.1 hypothetical protein [Bacteroidales bacterium]